MSVRTDRRAAQLNALGLADTRGSRFANRLAGIEGPNFTDLAAVPRWLMLPDNEKSRIAMAAGLLRHKNTIDRELSGQKLAALADVFGEDLVDAVAALPTDELAKTGLLALPETIVTEGWQILHRGLPAPFVIRFPAAANDATARMQADAAYNLVQSL